MGTLKDYTVGILMFIACMATCGIVAYFESFIIHWLRDSL